MCFACIYSWWLWYLSEICFPSNRMGQLNSSFFTIANSMLLNFKTLIIHYRWNEQLSASTVDCCLVSVAHTGAFFLLFSTSCYMSSSLIQHFRFFYPSILPWSTSTLHIHFFPLLNARYSLVWCVSSYCKKQDFHWMSGRLYTFFCFSSTSLIS